MPDPTRIAVVGPESSGKTTLVDHLRRWLTSRSVPVEVVTEQGRLLAERLPAGHAWSYREQLATALMHRGAEAAAAVVLRSQPDPGVLLADGTSATPLVWHLGAVRDRPGYDAGPPEVAEQLLTEVQSATYDAVLLVAPDLPWRADGIRDDPDGRQAAFEQYQLLFPDAVVISGDNRDGQAGAVVSRLLRISGAHP
ncbi:MAG: ATP-binding protein [Candidatus Nanopelagicales bacterium]